MTLPLYFLIICTVLMILSDSSVMPGSRSRSRSRSRSPSRGSADRSRSRSHSRSLPPRSPGTTGSSGSSDDEDGLVINEEGSPIRDSRQSRHSSRHSPDVDCDRSPPPARSRERDRGRSRERRRGDLQAGTERDGAGRDKSGERGAVIRLCSEHGNSLKPDICNACNNLGRLIVPDVMTELTKASAEATEEGEIPSASRRFSRSDEHPPSLIFSADSLDLAVKVFGLGEFKSPKYFEELTKGWLFLPEAQNSVLTGDISMETLFKKYENHPMFSDIFIFKNQVSKCHRDLRVSFRILILVQDKLDNILEKGRQAAKKLGFVFPDTPPAMEIFGPQPRANLLFYQSLPTFRPGNGLVSTLVLPAPVNLLDKCKNITKVNFLFCLLDLIFLSRKTKTRSQRTSRCTSQGWTPSERS